MSKQDIEYVMDKIEEVMKANLQSYITAMNTEKGDALLSDFEPASYLTYWLDSDTMPNYPVSFHQYFASTPVKSITGSTDVEVQVSIDVIVNIMNDIKGPIRVMRYMRVIKDLINEKIEPLFSSSSIQAVDYVQGRDLNKRLFLIGQTVLGGINVV